MYKRFLMLLTIKYVKSEMEGFIMGGGYTNIIKYPHSVFLDINGNYRCICGGSILNQAIVLSATHCFDEYRGRRSDKVIIKYGSTSLSSLDSTVMLYYRLHHDYKEVTIRGDIFLLRCKTPIKLGRSVKRIVVMKHPPIESMAYVSGWGTINSNQDMPEKLKQTKQKIQTRRTCRNNLSIPAGTFCAGPIEGTDHPAIGDSGAALMVHRYIQIGIVSFKEEHTSLVVYTNVSYYYSWIRSNAAFTYCAKRGRR